MSGAATKAMQSVTSTMFVSAALPATQDAAGYAALTASWKEIGELDTIPEYGPKSASVTRTPIKTGIVDKQKGSRDMGQLTLDMAWAPGDVGQAALITAEAGTAPVAFKVQLPDGTMEYFNANVMSYTRTPGASGNFVKAASMLDIKTQIVTVYPA